MLRTEIIQRFLTQYSDSALPRSRGVYEGIEKFKSDQTSITHRGGHQPSPPPRPRRFSKPERRQTGKLSMK